MNTVPAEVTRILDRVRAHEDWRGRDTLNLIPSENRTSPQVRALLSCDFGHRYTAQDRFYGGTRFMDEVEQACVELATQVFGCRNADIRFLSGHSCDMAAMMTLVRRGEGVMVVSPKHGGYPGIWSNALPRMLKLKVHEFPFNLKAMNIVPRKTIRSDPRLLIFGASVILFPQPIRTMTALYPGSISAYDGSHVMGLIAGNCFQSPLREGCDLLFGSTHKSFPGPQGGIMLSNNAEVFEVVQRSLYPAIIDNIHWNRVAALAYALAEMKYYGNAYASQITRNSGALAKALLDLGLPVFEHEGLSTRSHQVLLIFRKMYSADYESSRLEEVGIITDKGMRLGLNEVTRMGMKEKEMTIVAELISDTLRKKLDVAEITRRVKRLVSQFQTVKFTFDE